MGKRARGRERLVICDNCSRRIPRDKAVSFSKRVVYSTDLRTADDVRFLKSVDVYYCPSCGKHLRIYEKKKRMAERRNEQYQG